MKKKEITVPSLKIEDFLFNKYFKIDIKCIHNQVTINEFSIYVDMKNKQTHPFIVPKNLLSFLSTIKEEDERSITISSTHAIGMSPIIITLKSKTKYDLQDIKNYILLNIPKFYPYGKNIWVENKLKNKE